MKKIIIDIWVLCITLLAIPIAPVQAQNSEVGACVGTMFYIGELNQEKPFAFDKFKMAGGIVYRYNISPRWAIKANFLFGEVSASDAKTNDGYERNLSFFSPITEFSVVGELNFLQLYSSTGKNHFAPYIFAGFTLFSFDPMATLNDTVYHLQSLGTEGQGLVDSLKRYKLTDFAFPFGIGFRFNIGKHVCIGAEWGMRYTHTDYLDDVSGRYFDNEELKDRRGAIIARLADRTPELGPGYQLHKANEQRGNKMTKDFYSFVGVNLTVRFGNADRTCDLKNKRKKHK